MIETSPQFCKLLDVAVIRTALYIGLPLHEFGEKIYLIEYDTGNLEDPKSEPIAVYRRAGTQRFFWRGDTWCVYDINMFRYIEETQRNSSYEKDPCRLSEYAKLLNMLDRWVSQYQRLDEGHNLPESRFSVIYKIRSVIDESGTQ